jgi:phosphatidylglycerol---prolipoprotein diacylglyceryl transferase
MQPILAHLVAGEWSLTVHAYGTFLVLAAVAALVAGVVGARRAGFDGRAVAAIYVMAVVAGLVGARLLNVVLDPSAYADGSQDILTLAPRGFALYGGLGAAVAVVVAGVALLTWRAQGDARPEGIGSSPVGEGFGRTFGRLADSAVPAVVVGIVLLRIGCFLNGCCTGVATDLPVGVVFPSGPSAAGSLFGIETEAAAVHPTQLYELAAALLCGLGALWAVRAFPRVGSIPGAAALLFTAGFLLFRAGNQVLRTPDLAGDGAFLPAAYLAGGLVVAAVVAALLLRARTTSHAASARARDMRRSTIRSG